MLVSGVEVVRFLICFGVVILGALGIKKLLVVSGAATKISRASEMLLVVAIPAIIAAALSDAWANDIARFFNDAD